MSATDQDVRALEHLAVRLRQDTHGCGPWDAHGTHVVFARELKGMHLATAIEQVLHHACDPNAKTPAAIKRPFVPEAGAPVEPRCERHPSQYAADCGACEAEERRAHQAPGDARAAAVADCLAAIRDSQTMEDA